MQPTIELIDTDAKLLAVFDLLLALQERAPVGLDFETSGPNIKPAGKGKKSRPDPYAHRLTGASASWDDWCCYIPVRHKDGDNVSLALVLEFATAMLGRPRCWVHTLGYELNILRNEGVIINSSRGKHDSEVAAWLAGWRFRYNVKSLKLKPLRVFVGLPERKNFDDIAKRRQVEDVPVAEMFEYASLDAYDTVRVGEAAYKHLVDMGLERHFHDIDMPNVEVLRAMEAAGMEVDSGALQSLGATLKAEAAVIAAEFEQATTTLVALPVKRPIQAVDETGAPAFFKNGKPKMTSVFVPESTFAGASISNPNDVSRWMYDELKLWPLAGLKRGDVGGKGKGPWPVDKETIEPYTLLPGEAGRLAQAVLDWRSRDKLHSTYVLPLLDLPRQYGDGRLHARFRLTGTDTQRLSSSEPNLQNIPSRTAYGKLIRGALRAAFGKKLGVCDLNQAELRIAGHLARDEELITVYTWGEDVHAGTLATMKQFWDGFQRTDAKVTNFSTMYNIEPPNLAIKMRCSEERAALAIAAFWKRFAGVDALREWSYEYAKEHGFVRTIDGFKRLLANRVVRNYRTGELGLGVSIQNQTLNTMVQGSVGGWVKIAQLQLHERWTAEGICGKKVALVANEHDSLVTEFDDEPAFEAKIKADVVGVMENVFPLRLPMRADWASGYTWREAKGG